MGLNINLCLSDYLIYYLDTIILFLLDREWHIHEIGIFKNPVMSRKTTNRLLTDFGKWNRICISKLVKGWDDQVLIILAQILLAMKPWAHYTSRCLPSLDIFFMH